jgi:hypothetical protein
VLLGLYRLLIPLAVSLQTALARCRLPLAATLNTKFSPLTPPTLNQPIPSQSLLKLSVAVEAEVEVRQLRKVHYRWVAVEVEAVLT